MCDGIPNSVYCNVWSQSQYRTFDGRFFSFNGQCTYLLVTDYQEESFKIYVQNNYPCFHENSTACRAVVIDNSDPYNLIYLLPGGKVRFDNEPVDLPRKVGGVVLEQTSNYIRGKSGLGFTIIYDGKDSITVYITDTELLTSNTAGLCGLYDGDPTNDFFIISANADEDQATEAHNFGQFWIMDLMEERDNGQCLETTATTRCTQKTYFESDDEEAFAQWVQDQCSPLQDYFFADCQIDNKEAFVIACEEDVCECAMRDESCRCASFAAFALECARNGTVVPWRSHFSCPFECPVNSTKVYNQCGSTCDETSCNSVPVGCETEDTIGCLEGCYCPPMTYKTMSGGCVTVDECPCSWQGNEYQPSERNSDGCNECTCMQGKWQCTQNDCGATCIVSGQGHYKTFDNHHYDFAGSETCSYVLLKDCWNKGNNYSVSVENAECGMEAVSCVKAVVIDDHNEEVSLKIELRRGHKVFIDKMEEKQYPMMARNYYLNQPTSSQTAVIMPNGITILFDGYDQVTLMADERHLNTTCGLCGTYNNNHRDDFYTDAGDVETNPTSFGNKWKALSCPDAKDDTIPDPCDLYSQKEFFASKECGRLLYDNSFAYCRQFVDPWEYYDKCRHDVCNCLSSDNCVCSVFSMYAAECAHRGVVIDWRTFTPSCEMKCKAGMIYEPCHPMCQTSCRAISFDDTVCSDTCIDGCACPDGYVIDERGECVLNDHCGCLDHDTGVFHTHQAQFDKGCGSCKCLSGELNCTDVDCPSDMCSFNQEYDPCPRPCEKTCQNMHNFDDCQITSCQGRCVCIHDTVWNGTNCIEPSTCPCHHGGQSYPENHIINTYDCRKCICVNNKWECEEFSCYGDCTSWGDPHLLTFDGKHYDFEGDCEYILAMTNNLDPEYDSPSFSIITSNVPCGTTGITCTKSITFTIKNADNSKEKLHLVKGKEVPASDSTFIITQAGDYVHVASKIGVKIVWDSGTWVQVKIAPKYKGKVGGLCGNYNDLSDDDFMSPDGGLPETSALTFGDSWKVDDYCPKPPPPISPCMKNPHRRGWAMRQCSVIKSDVFEQCFSQVYYRLYFLKCIYDSCACDSGGDCECLCSAISAYAKECAAHGVPIRWRTNDLCPMQCDGCREYDPCIELCYTCGHENDWDEDGNCPHTCFEGCSCPSGQFHYGDQCVDSCPVATTPYIDHTTTTPYNTIPQGTTTQPPETTTGLPGTTTTPPETTTGPPGTTTQPPQTTTGPPGTTSQPPETTTLPPGTTTKPPETTTGPSGTTTQPPETTTGPPGTTSQPPETTPLPPGTTTTPPETTTGPPGTTSQPPETTGPPRTTTTPPETTTGPPGTTTQPPETTTGPPGTTTQPPGTTPLPPGTTTTPPETTTGPPGTTTTPQETTTGPPGTTTQPPETTTGPPGTTTQPPETTTGPPGTTSQPPETTTLPPGTTTKPPETTTGPLGTTSQPPETTPLPPGTTTTPPETTTLPPGTTTQPPETTTGPPGTTTHPPETTTGPPGTTSQPPETTTLSPGTTTTPPETTTGLPGTTTQPPETTTGPPGTTTQPPETTTGPPGTTSQPPETTTLPPGTTTKPPETTTGPPGTTTQPPETTTGPQGTTSQPPETTTLPPGTTTKPPETTTGPPGTTSQPPETTPLPPGTTTTPPETTTGPPGTTTTPPETTTGPPGTTTQPPETTTGPPGTTTQPPETTPLPPGTTTTPPETTTGPPGTTTTPPE
ncbi:mucin-2-like, partial [Lytechinus variegatus]|uniref:mucin-2-like n=1 Tax=Lytechinus variegatus TaxID=7654 RepID=UPI001BB2789D